MRAVVVYEVADPALPLPGVEYAGLGDASALGLLGVAHRRLRAALVEDD